MMTAGEKKCAKKVRYFNRQEARRAKRKMRKKYGWDAHIYTCGLCLGYHLSSLTRSEVTLKRINKKQYEQSTTDSERRGHSSETSEIEPD
jgi:hypothetical protein